MKLIDLDELQERIENPEYALYDADMTLEWIEECVVKTPIIEAEPMKHGKWIKDGISRFHVCSNCKDESMREHDAWGYEIDETLSDYCPWCGAKMYE